MFVLLIYIYIFSFFSFFPHTREKNIYRWKKSDYFVCVLEKMATKYMKEKKLCCQKSKIFEKEKNLKLLDLCCKEEEEGTKICTYVCMCVRVCVCVCTWISWKICNSNSFP